MTGTNASVRALAGGLVVALVLPLLLLLPAPAQSQPAGSATPRADPEQVHLFVAATQAASDVTAAAKDTGAGDVWLSKPAGDALYIGRSAPFFGLVLEIATSAQGGQVQWQFSKGQGWEPLVARDSSDQFRKTGAHTLVWDLPPTWAATAVPNVSTSPLYWIRAMTLQAFASAPILSQIQLDAWVGPLDVRYQTQTAWSSEVAVTTLEVRDVTARAGVYVAVGAGGLIFRSTDHGDSWVKVPSPVDRQLNGVAFLTDSSVLAVGALGTLLRSEDKGKTWSYISGVANNDLNDIATLDGQKIVIAGNEIILRSNDAGAHWTNTPRPGDHLWSVSFPTSLRGYVGGDKDVDEVLLTTDDGGTEWEPIVINPALYSSITDLDAMDFRTENYGWIVGNGYIARTLNGGGAWTVQPTTGPMRGIKMGTASEGWAVGDAGLMTRITMADQPTPVFTDQVQDGTFFFRSLHAADARNAVVVGWNGQILRTTNAGGSWMQPAYKSTTNLNGVDALPDGTIWATGAAGALLRSLDGGYSWTLIPSAANGELHGVEFVNANVGWITGAAGVIRKTTNGAETWTQQSVGVPTNLFDVDFVDQDTGWIVGGFGKLFKTTNGGATWTERSTGVTNTLRHVDFVDRNVGYIVGLDGVILKSVNGGENWLAQTSGTTRSLLSVHFHDATRGYIVGDYGRIMTTVDGGATWVTRTSGVTDILYDVRARDAQNAWAVGQAGAVLVTTDGGQSWIEHPPGVDTSWIGITMRPSGAPLLVGQGGALVRAETAWSQGTSIHPVRGGMTPIPLIVTPGEAFYVGQASRFDSVAFRTHDSHPNVQVIWEYWQGQEWVALNTRDGSGLFSNDGWSDLSFPLPTDWEISVFPASQPGYYIRARLLSVPTDGQLAIDGVLTARLPSGVAPPTTTPTTGATSPTTASASGGSTSGSATSSAAPSNGPRSSGPPPTSHLPGFRFRSDPDALDLGHVRRGSTAQTDLNLEALEGAATLRLTVLGPDAAHFTITPDLVTVQGTVPTKVKVLAAPAADAPAGPRESHIAVRPAAAPPDSTPLATIPLKVIVDAAELRKVGYQASPPAWTAEFANFLDHEVAVRVDASIQTYDGAFVQTGRFEQVFAPGATHAIMDDLEVYEVPAGPYRVRLNGTYGPDRVDQELVVWLGGAPAEVSRILVGDVRLGHAQVTVDVTNRLEYPMTVRPRLDIVTAEGDPITSLFALAVPLAPHETQTTTFQWDAVFGAYVARATAEVENAEVAPPAEAPIVLLSAAQQARTPAPHLPLLLLGLAAAVAVAGRRPV